MTTNFVWTFGDALLAALLLVVAIGILGEWIAGKFYRRRK
jgi:hypothetical protein